MNKLSSRIFSLIPAIVCFSNSYLCSFESHNELEINSSLKLHIDLSGEAVLGGKINVKLSALSDELKKLENVNVNLLIDRGIFRFIKKYFDYSDIFKIKTEKLENNMMRIEFILKNKKEFLFSDSPEMELMNFDLNIKKKIEQNESDLIFKFDIDDIKKDFSQHISMSPKITNIEIENQEKDINFDENTRSYKLVVPYEEKCLDLKISKTLDGKEEFESKHVKLKKAGSSTLVKVENYEIEIDRLEKENTETPKKEKSQENTQEKENVKKTKTKKNKINGNSKSPKKLENKSKKVKTKTKSKDKNKKLESKKEKIQEICEENLEQDIESNIENNIDKDDYKEIKEEKIENNQNNDKIKWALGCTSIVLALFMLFIKLKRKKKDQK